MGRLGPLGRTLQVRGSRRVGGCRGFCGEEMGKQTPDLCVEVHMPHVLCLCLHDLHVWVLLLEHGKCTHGIGMCCIPGVCLRS